MYLKYAICEIVLVVIGILIALKINTWNTKQLYEFKEKDYLTEIKENLRSDKISTKIVLDFNEIKVRVIDFIEVYKDRSKIASIRLMKANILVQNGFIDIQIDTLN